MNKKINRFLADIIGAFFCILFYILRYLYVNNVTPNEFIELVNTTEINVFLVVFIILLAVCLITGECLNFYNKKFSISLVCFLAICGYYYLVVTIANWIGANFFNLNFHLECNFFIVLVIAFQLFVGKRITIN